MDHRSFEFRSCRVGEGGVRNVAWCVALDSCRFQIVVDVGVGGGYYVTWHTKWDCPAALLCTVLCTCLS